MRLEMRLLPPQQPMLRYAHLERVIDKFPQTENNTINYVIAGGGSAMLLFEAEDVDGYEVIDSEADHRRKHKDLELYAFQPVFGRLNPNPHDIVTLRYSGRFYKVNYQQEPPSDFELMIEILRGFYYDFMTPKEEDTTAITTSRGNRFLTLRPEFVIASKLFSANGIRRGTDDKDAIALLKRFRLDEDYLDSLIKNSEFAPVFQLDGVGRLAEDVESGVFYSRVAERVEELYGQDVPEVRGLPYSEKISVLRYDLEDLALSEEQRKLIDANSESQPEQNSYGNFRDFHRLCLRYIVSNLSPDGRTQKHLEKFSDLARRDQHLAIAVSSALRQTLGLLHQVYGGDQNDYDEVADKVTGKVLSTFYMHALTSAIRRKLSDNIREGVTTANYSDLVQGF